MTQPDDSLTFSFVQYDDDGEIVHVASVWSGDEETHRASQNSIAARMKAGEKVLVLGRDDPQPEHGKDTVVNGKIKRRTDAQYAAWQKAQQPIDPGKPQS